MCQLVLVKQNIWVQVLEEGYFIDIDIQAVRHIEDDRLEIQKTPTRYESGIDICISDRRF